MKPMEYGQRAGTFYFSCRDTPFGVILAATGIAGVRAILLGNSEADVTRELKSVAAGAALIEDADSVVAILDQVVAYTDTPQRRPKLRMDLRGTPLQLAVWDALCAIPGGRTRSYGDIAKSLAVAATAQDVGAACAANVLALLVPCHRVVKADGSISGYRWGVHRKRRLLEREAFACRR
jgi:AraC family transcriptional regulator of adaptative response/methylated-DNA-[protein]-cysteine methyltransferase